MALKGFFFFPGQGAQVVGMAKDAHDAGGHARALFEEASEILGFDLARLTFEGDDAELAKTANCQPALLVASIALLETLREHVQVEMTGAMGLSLGEYTALVALEAMDFSDAVRLVRKRGELMESAAEGQDSGMVSVLGLEDEKVEAACREASALGVVVPANYNCPGQLVISGEKAALAKAAELCKEAGAKRCLPLDVSAAFHSPLMDAARRGLEAALADTPLREPTGRFVNNAEASELSDPEAIRASLGRQLVSPVRWTQSCQHVLGLGETAFYEVGPGKTLQGMMRRIDKDAAVTGIAMLEHVMALADY